MHTCVTRCRKVRSVVSRTFGTDEDLVLMGGGEGGGGSGDGGCGGGEGRVAWAAGP